MGEEKEASYDIGKSVVTEQWETPTTIQAI
jgi:hypothetical protein